MVTFFHLPNHLLPHSLHAVLHIDKLARRYFSMGGTEQFECRDSVRKPRCVCVFKCVCVCGGYVGKMCAAE